MAPAAERPAAVSLAKLRPALFLLALTGAGLAGNHFSLPFSFGVDFLFGGVAAMLAVRIFPLVWGVPVAAAVAGYSIVLWGHPYGAVVFTLEALVVGLWTTRDEDLAFRDGVFWAVLGLPLIWVLYAGPLDMDRTSVVLVMLKQSVNGLFNAVVAGLLLSHLPFRRWAGVAEERASVSFQRSFVNLLVAFVIIPALLLVVVAGRDQFRMMRKHVADDLANQSSLIRMQLDTWNQRHLGDLSMFVETTLGGRQVPIEALREAVVRLGRQIPGAIRIEVADGAGDVVALYQRDGAEPGAAGPGQTIHLRVAVGTGALSLSSAGGPVPFGRDAGITHTGLASAAGGSGIIRAVLAPEYFDAFVQAIKGDGEREITVIDGADGVMASTDPAARTGAAFDFTGGGTLEAVDGGNGILHWLPPAAGLPKMARWQRSRFLKVAALDDAGAWRLVVAIPAASYVDRLRVGYSYDFGFTLAIVLAAQILGTLLRRKLVAPLVSLARVTTDLPDKILHRRAVDWPKSPLVEIESLIGNFKSMVGRLSHEILERERIAEEITRMIDTNTAPIFGIDASGKVNLWNQAAARVTGCERDEVLGRDLVDDLVVAESREGVREHVAEAMRGRQPESSEVSLRAKDGTVPVLLVNFTARRDADGAIFGVIGIGQDITERRRVQAELIQASKLATLGEMATAVAHELNQPLNIIRMAADSAIDAVDTDGGDVAFLRGKFERISRQAGRAAAIIDHMRIFGRKADDKPHAFDPRDAVLGALSLMGEQLRLKDIQVVTHIPKHCRKVSGHDIQFEQVVLNLLTNARDAIELRGGDTDRATPERRIDLEVADDPSTDTLRIRVRDTGSGIPEAVMGRIFEPFFTTKEIGSGTGLGLSISYGIVTDMGGVLEARNVDDGAELTISLPVAGGDAESGDSRGGGSDSDSRA
ncbi:MAG: PAS domain-containing protein [Proteobacteria bacterium]|nr:PAS domain-containing protein [Pseudomonadota bacterium]